MRYHQEWRNGLSGGMGRLEKFMRDGVRRAGDGPQVHAEVRGRGRHALATSALSTVEGTVARYHPRGWNAGVEMAAPDSRTSAEDWIAQPWRSSILGTASDSGRRQWRD